MAQARGLRAHVGRPAQSWLAGLTLPLPRSLKPADKRGAGDPAKLSAAPAGATVHADILRRSDKEESAMLSREENDPTPPAGPGPPLAKQLRRSWTPALFPRGVAEPGGPPPRPRLRGEDLGASRDTEGRIGLIGEFGPHRRVSLYFGRNEECG